MSIIDKKNLRSMRLKRILRPRWALMFTIVFGLSCGSGWAWANRKHSNLKVLKPTRGALKRAMKSLSRGLGVKCTKCHVKKDFESEANALKDKTRFFFRQTVDSPDVSKRKMALEKLLKVMELDSVNDEAKVWLGIEGLEKI